MATLAFSQADYGDSGACASDFMKLQASIATALLVLITATPLAAADHQFEVEQNFGTGALTNGEIVIYAGGVPIAFYPLVATHEYTLRQWITCDGTVVTVGDSHIQGVLIEGSSATSLEQADWTGSWVVAGLTFVGTGGPEADAYPTGVHAENVGYSASGVLATDAILSLLQGDEDQSGDPSLIDTIKRHIINGDEITFSVEGNGPHTIYATSERFDVCHGVN